MALNRSNKYPGRFLAPTTARPQGAFKNRTSPTAQDGSYLEADWANDWDGFFARILTVAGVTPNGNVDSGTASQLYDALLSAMPGRLINRQVLSGAGTYTPSPGTKLVKIRAVGGGGGGGGCPSTVAGQQACANGGQSGAYAELIAPISSASYPYITGAGGSVGPASSAGGGAGGQTSISGIFSAPGGLGGIGGVSSNSTITVGNNGPSTSLPTVSSGTPLLLLPPNPGEPFIALGSAVQQQRGGRGGSNPLGIGGAPGVGAAGAVGRGYGAGGGGCSQYANNAGDIGGAGLAGIIIVEEFS